MIEKNDEPDRRERQPHRERLNWMDRLVGARNMPREVLSGVRREQVERAIGVAPVIVLGQLVVGLVLFATAVDDRSSPGALTWLACLLGLVAWGALGALCSRMSRRVRKFVFSTSRIYAVGVGVLWGSAPLALAAADPYGIATLMLGAGGVLVVAALLMVVVPELSIATCVTGGLTFFTSTALLMPFEHSASVGMLVGVFFGTLPFCIVQGARGMIQRQREGFITRERHATARYLLESHEAQGSDMLWECDGELRMQRPSKRLCKLSGMSPDEVRGMPWASFLSDVGVSAMGLSNLASALKKATPFDDVRVELRRDGNGGAPQRMWLSVSGRPRHDGAGQFAGFVGIGRDITAEHEANRELLRLAETDRLTGLANRHFFRSVLAAAAQRQDESEGKEPSPDARREHRFAVLVFDLERFRSINATFGHALGDRLLVSAAQRIMDCLQGQPVDGTCLARLAGDEFALMLDETGKAGAARIAVAIAEALARPFELDGRIVRTSARIGIALAAASAPIRQIASEREQRGDEIMLQRAELALSCVKADGRGAWRFFDPGMDLEQSAALELERDLAEHLPLAATRFELVYQPLVEPRNGRVLGMEALIRWNHPERGTISPATFIPMAERLGFIERIGRWSLETACREAAGWATYGAGGHAPRVAVNISAPHFAGGQLLDHVRGALAASGLAPDRLEIEVTESVLVDDVGEAERTLLGLRAEGVHVALDDFGTGYSSLGYLQRFSFDKLKIDRRFVVSGEKDERSKRILAMIVELGRTLDMTVVAEGIETPAQARMATSLGCDLLQGYLFSRPVSAEAARALVEADAAGTPSSMVGAGGEADLLRPKLAVVAA